MTRRNLILILTYALVILLVAYIMPTRIDWSPNYGSEKKQPLGTFALFSELPQLFPEVDIRKADLPLFNELRIETDNTFNYLLINHSFQPDEIDIAHMLNKVNQGANFFLSSQWISYKLQDTLGIEINPGYRFNLFPFNEDTLYNRYVLTHPLLSTDTLRLPDVMAGSEMDIMADSVQTRIEILGIDSADRINFFSIELGDGKIFFHLTPAAFSNYALLHSASGSYVSSCLSHLPIQKVIWDEYYCNGASSQSTPLRTLLRYPALKWAFYLLVFGVLFFMIFGIKRKQRSIPVLRPYKNESLSFIRTISAMHYNHRDNLLIIDKRLSELKSVLMARFKFKELAFNNEESNIVYEYSGIPEKLWIDLCAKVTLVRQAQNIKPGELKEISESIDSIYSYLKL